MAMPRRADVPIRRTRGAFRQRRGLQADERRVAAAHHEVLRDAVLHLQTRGAVRQELAAPQSGMRQLHRRPHCGHNEPTVTRVRRLLALFAVEPGARGKALTARDTLGMWAMSSRTWEAHWACSDDESAETALALAGALVRLT